MNHTQCLSLSGSKVCAPWMGRAVNVSSEWALADFDAALDMWSSSPQHTANFNSIYNCTWNGSGLRYVSSYGCAERVFASDAMCNLAPTPPLCRRSCLIYFRSLTDLLKNTLVCPGSLETRSETLKYVESFCTSLASDHSSCIAATPAEKLACGFIVANSGFPNAADAAEFCKSSDDPCCSALSSSYDSKQLLFIALIACLISSIILYFIYRKFISRRSKAAMDEAKETYDTGTLSKGFKDGSIRHTAVNTFIRHRNDEINVADGHLILIDKVYDDGWIMGRNETLKTRGMFPAACLEETI